MTGQPIESSYQWTSEASKEHLRVMSIFAIDDTWARIASKELIDVIVLLHVSFMAILCGLARRVLASLPVLHPEYDRAYIDVRKYLNNVFHVVKSLTVVKQKL